MVKVKAREGESLDDLMRRFKKAVSNARILDDCRKHEFFLNKKLRREQKAKLSRIANSKR